VLPQGQRPDPATPRVNNGISGDGRKSTPELGKKLFEMKSDYAVKQIRQLLRAPASGQYAPGGTRDFWSSTNVLLLGPEGHAMTKEVTLRQAGGSVSATLPKDMADRLHLEAGDRVLAVETDRGILLTPYDPEAERALQVATRAAKKYRNALRELAK